MSIENEYEMRIGKLSDYIDANERLKSYYPNRPIIHKPTSLSFLYRGHANVDYQLIPGLFRKQKDICDENGGCVTNYTYLCYGKENDIIHSFMQEAMNYIQIPENDISRWTEYAQHYGVPTRFLDWSKNPFVALYFACRDQKETDGKVWLLHAKNYDYQFPPENDDLKDKTRQEIASGLIKGTIKCEMPLLYTPFYVDNRMSAQSSYFMVWGTKEESFEQQFSDDKYLMRLPRTDNGIRTYGEHEREAILFSFTIPAGSKQHLLRELDTVGINEKTLFPGLDGIGRYVERKFRFNYFEAISGR